MKAAQLEIGVLRLSCCGALLLRGRRKESEVRSQNQCFYKYEMLPSDIAVLKRTVEDLNSVWCVYART